MKYASLILLLFLASVANAQSAKVEVAYPSMPILKKSIGLWECQRVVADVTVHWPDGGKSKLRKVKLKASVDESGDAEIPATLVRGLMFKSVDACTLRGWLDDGSEIVCELPPEPVRIKRFQVTALAIDCPTTITKWDGTTWQGIVTNPDCITDATGLRSRMARPVTGTGTLTRK